MQKNQGFGTVNNIKRGIIYNPSDRRLVGSVQQRIGLLTNGSKTALGNRSGSENQGDFAIAIGNDSGHNNQSDNAISLGNEAGHDNQGQDAIALGRTSGMTTQGGGAIAIGFSSGTTGQSANSVAVGAVAGQANLGTNAVAIGANASADGGSFANTIVVNAGTTALNPAAANTFSVKPVAPDTATDSGANPFANNLPTGFNVALYNSTTGEFRYWNPA